MMVSYTDRKLVDEVSTTLLAHSIYEICQNRRENAIPSTDSSPKSGLEDTSSCGPDNNYDWTTYFQQNIPHDLSSALYINIMNEIRRRRLSYLVSSDSLRDTSTQPSDVDILEMAYAKIEFPWNTIQEEYNQYLEIFSEDRASVEEKKPNSKATQNNTSSSISLFNLSSNTPSSTSMLNSFMTLDIIKERTDNNLLDMIAMLKDVSYLEDLLPDIDEICVLLRTQLVSLVANINQTTFEDSTLGPSIIDLHRHWFHRTRKGILQPSTSHDHRTIQIELTFNLVQVIQTVDSQQPHHTSNTIHTELYESCILAILDMFGDWMDRNIYKHNDLMMKDIGRTLWKWSTMSTTAQMPGNVNKQSMIYHYCPTGHWMCQYLTQRYMTNNDLTELLSERPLSSNTESTNTLLEIYHVATNCWKNIISLIVPVRNDDVCTYIWILSLFRSILLATRVSHFPWNLLCPSTMSTSELVDKIDTPKNELASFRNQLDPTIPHIFGLYHQMLLLLMDDSQSGIVLSLSMTTIETVGCICMDSIEILICGTQRQEFSNVQQRMMQDMNAMIGVHVKEDINFDVRSNANYIGTMIRNMIHRLYLSDLHLKSR